MEIVAERLDTLRRRATPEGVTLALRVAGMPSRALAWLIDALILLALYLALAIVLAIFGAVGSGVYLIVMFVLQWFYSVLFEVLNRGATPGKRVLGLRVIHDDGTPIDWSASIIRNLLRAADFLPFAYFAGILTMLCQRDFKRLGDIAAGTLVIYDQRKTLNEEKGIPRALPVPPPAALQRDERQAIIGFGERVSRINAERAAELAQVLAPLTKDTGGGGVERIVGMANWILGRHEPTASPSSEGED